MQTVGGEHHLGLLGVAVREDDAGATGGVLAADDVLVVEQVDPGPPAGAQEGGVQVAAVDHEVGEAVVPLDVAQVEASQL